MKLMIAIDGACRRNGKPDCTSSGGVFIQTYDDNNVLFACDTIATHEHNSTNQRGELLALYEAIHYINKVQLDTLIVTDSEYIFNAMTKNWYTNWINNSWLTRAGDPVKNDDIWKDIVDELNHCYAELTFYHVKGHCIPFGRVTADNLLTLDSSGGELYDRVFDRYDELAPTKEKVFNAARELSERNNGFVPTDDIFKKWVVANVVADAVATREVDAADQRS
jgi:ribonuclease HI